MKKTLAVAVLFVMLVSLLVTGVNAVSTSELVEKLYEMGQPYGITSADKVKLERFLSENPVSEADADAILAKAEAAISIMEDAGVTDVKQLTTAQKNQIKSLANEAASILGVTLVFKAGNLEVYKDGALVETLSYSNDKLAYTGNTVNMVLVVSSVAVIALVATYVVARKRLATVNA